MLCKYNYQQNPEKAYPCILTNNNIINTNTEFLKILEVEETAKMAKIAPQTPRSPFIQQMPDFYHSSNNINRTETNYLCTQ